MNTVYFVVGDHLRRTVNGSADCCSECGIPRRFSREHEEIAHPCSMSEEVLSDAEIEAHAASLEDDDLVYEEEDDDDMLDLGFAMREMSTNTDYGGVIE